jgi:DNA modification methylase
MQTEIDIERRSDYTFKYNTQFGRHGWLRLTPAYSVKLVRELIKKNCNASSVILDPFSGTATTGLVAAELGYKAVLFDINPFLIWLGNTKSYNFTIQEIDHLNNEFENCINNIVISNSFWKPPIHNIERWWHPETLILISSIRESLVAHFGEPSKEASSNLVWIAFSRLIIETSSAAFNHVSMSFKEESIQYGYSQIKFLFKTIFLHILNSAKMPIEGVSIVLKGDSKDLSAYYKSYFDTVITSPPYPNRISYIRELRPYMYWSKFLRNGGDAGILDWEAIGGTWGTATSNLKDWKPTNQNLPIRLYEVCEKIALSGDKNSLLMSLYVHKYFDDMFSHLENLRPILKPNAKLNYIVGNSSFYGHFVDTEKILLEIFIQIGYKNVSVDIIRRRNTKRGLLEFNVKAVWKK